MGEDILFYEAEKTENPRTLEMASFLGFLKLLKNRH
jgi:hypothetical protein